MQKLQFLSLVALGATVLGTAPAFTQTETATPPSETVPAEARLTLSQIREILQDEGSETDKAAALAQLKLLADEGNSNALRLLGDTALAAGDRPGAIAALNKAAEGGSVPAMLRLAAILMEPGHETSDPTRAVALLEQAAALGDDRPKSQLLRVYSGKVEGVAADPEKARALLSQAMEAGNTAVAEQYGDYASQGLGGPVDAAAAADAWRKAGEAGSATAWLKLGRLLMDPAADRLDPGAAKEAFLAAAELGSVPAQMQLMAGAFDGSFGGKADVAEGLKHAKLLSEAGVISGTIRILDLADQARAAGIDVDAASKAAEAAIAEGNMTPAGALYRYLTSPAAGKNEAARLAALRSAYPEFVPLSIRAKAAFSLADYAKYAEEVKATDPARRAGAIRQLRSGSVNAYVYLVQDLLAEKGLYAGARNGLLTGTTISAFNRYCKDQGILAECVEGPISGRATKAFATAISAETP